AEVMKDAGYATGLVGKWHLGINPPLRPNRRGFDEFYGFLFVNSLYIDMRQPGVKSIRTIEEQMGHARDDTHQIYRNETPSEETEYLTDAFALEAVGFIERHRQEPFFLVAAFSAPHTPLQATARYLDRFPGMRDEARRVYAAMVSALDDGVGAILNK